MTENSSENHAPDIWLSRDISDTELTETLAHMYSCPHSQIWVVPSDYLWMNSSELDRYLVICMRRHLINSEFPSFVSVIPLRKELLSADRFEIAYQLAENLECVALIWTVIEGYTSQYWEFTLVRKQGDYQGVLVDPNVFDDEDTEGSIKITHYLEKNN
jgi:hypothetical protein